MIFSGINRNLAARRQACGITVVELLVSIAVLAMVMALTMPIVASLSSSWTRMSGRGEMFSAARAGLEAMSRTLQQATLQSHFSYADASGNPVPLINPSLKVTGLNRSQIPTQYLRSSELHFVAENASDLMQATGASSLVTPGYAVFFQAPLGQVTDQANLTRSTLLNSVGYYIEYGDDRALLPSIVSSSKAPRKRYRLMEVIQPARKNAIYQSTLEEDVSTGLPSYNYDLNWIQSMDLGSDSGDKHVLAENIVFLAFLPKLSSYSTTNQGTLASNYVYDSRWWEPGYTGASAKDERIRNQLPPLVEIVMVAIDEPSAIRLESLYGGSPGGPFSSAGVKAKVDFDTLFQSADRIDEDIEAVENGLSDLRVNYRIFRTDVGIPAAKWSGTL